MSDDICDRLMRFAGKVCLSTDTEVEAADEIERLRAENEKLRETQKLLIDALKETLAVACRNEDGYYAQAARKVLAAAIREGERDDG